MRIKSFYDTYSIYGNLILRTPAYSFNELTNSLNLEKLWNDKFFREAVYLASPSLIQAWAKALENPTGRSYKKLQQAIHRYFIRIMSRCTPFGLFSGCSVQEWAHKSEHQHQIVLDKVDRCTRLDMFYLCELARYITNNSAIRKGLKFYSNNTLYEFGGDFRYIETILGKKRKYIISSITSNDVLLSVLKLAENGSPYDSITSHVKNLGFSSVETEEFVEILISENLLVSELEPQITGQNYLEQIIGTLERLVKNGSKNTDVNKYLEILQEVSQLLAKLDSNVCNDPEVYASIIEKLKLIHPPLDEGKLFQVDSKKKCITGKVDVLIQQKLMLALNVLNKLSPYRPNENLESFKSRFRERYGDEEVPLLIALDIEAGLLYPDVPRKPASSLISDLSVVQFETELDKPWGKVETLLSEKLLTCLKENQRVIKISDADIEGLEDNWENMPLSFYVMFRAINTGDATLFIESVGGASGVNLLSRFAHTDEQIKSHIQAIAELEKQYSSNEVIAEIVHLPEDRVGNILIHPPIRDYEIPYLAQSSKKSDQQIKLKDILVSVRNNKIILRSKLLNKIIKPRLSNAHNYKLNALPVYRFLADIQFQDTRANLGLSWGHMQKQHPYFPRVQYGDVILQLAQWRLKTEEIFKLRNLEGKSLQSEIVNFRSKWNLPNKVVLAESDNELFIDLTNEASIYLLIDSIGNRKYFVLKEFVEPSDIVCDRNGILANQFVAIFHKTSATEQITASEGTSSSESRNSLNLSKGVQAKFPVGSEWVYYKLYCGEKSADKVLINCIFKILTSLRYGGIIRKWFFIRYSDPQPHVRFRINVHNVSDIGEVIASINEQTKEFLENGLIWKIQIDTYERELLRYGASAIEQIEDLFYFDSECSLQILSHIRGTYFDSERWLLCMKIVDNLLDSFGYDLFAKESILFHLKSAFNEEFRTDISIKKRINDKYRAKQLEISDFMTDKKTDHFILEVLKVKSIKTEKISS
ncbi:lantibiotic dehydratase [Olivibacter jilunii]